MSINILNLIQTTVITTNLCEYIFSMVGNHVGLFTIEDNGGVLERFFAILEDVIDVSHATLKKTAEISGNEAPADGWMEVQREKRKEEDSFNSFYID